jgi:putative membrane protein
MGLCVGGGSFFESLGLRTGFPFGNYYFTGVMGPKVFQLPILLALAYVGVGYVAWVVASLIVGAGEDSWRRVVVLPLIAAVTMTAWDVTMDPVWGNIDRAWVWERGGGYFGVPFGNYFGWLLTTWVFYQVFALWGRRREVEVVARGWNRLAVLMYGLVGAGNLLLALPGSVPAGYPRMVADAAGRRWLIADVVENCVLVSVFVMGPLALVAWVRGGGAAPGRGRAEAHSNLEGERLGVA